MMRTRLNHDRRVRHGHVDRAFTLMELLVTMTIIVIIAVLTIVSIRSVFLEARLSSGLSAVSASLGQARALAMKSGRPVLVAFYPALTDPGEQRISVVLAQWEGDTRVEDVDYMTGTYSQIFARFRPIDGVSPRLLPQGINVAGPFFFGGASSDGDSGFDWLVPTNLREPSEAPGRIVGVMFDAVGTMVTEIDSVDAEHVWIDFEPVWNSSTQQWEQSRSTSGTAVDDWYLLVEPDDEMNVTLVPYLAVFNERDARDRYDDTAWTDPDIRDSELSEYVRDFADRLHFNRYTGVAMQ